MKNELDELFRYCQIPRAGQRYLSLYCKNEALKNFSSNHEAFKYLNPYGLACRFFFATKDVPYLYHFLPGKDLEKILQSGIFYIGNQKNMNDPLEKDYVWLKVRKYLKDHSSSSDVVTKFDSLKKIAYSRMLDTYVWSFTREINSKYFSHNYGNMAFEVKTSLIWKFLNKSNKKFNSKNLFHVELVPSVYPIKICYDIDVQNEYIFYLAKLFLQACEEHDLESCEYLISVLTFYMLVFKNNTWSQEKEYRFLISRPIENGKEMCDCYFLGKPKIKGLINPKILSSVIISKSQKSKNYISEIKKSLLNQGFNSTRIKEY